MAPATFACSSQGFSRSPYASLATRKKATGCGKQSCGWCLLVAFHLQSMPSALYQGQAGLPGQQPPAHPPGTQHSLEERARPLMKTLRNFLEKWMSASGVESSERQTESRFSASSSYSSPMADS